MARGLHALAAEVMARLDILATVTAEPGRLTRLYLTAEHARANALVGGWMREAGMSVRVDAVGNLIGRYEGARPGLPALLLGSHLDSVIDAGRYDGPLGVLAGIAAVQVLARDGLRLPFAVEVVGFADEEGVRFASTFIGSRALAGTLDPKVLTVRDQAGTSMAEALQGFGLEPQAVGRAARERHEVLGYVELHIEQGPVLEAEGLPLGIVTAIAGQTRLLAEIAGEAGHAGTVPMGLRKDALAAAAEIVLLVERRCTGAGLVGTVGRLEVQPGAINVIPAACRLTMDIRAAEDAAREAAVAELRAGAAEIACRRGVACTLGETHGNPSIACDPELRRRLASAVAAEGLPVRELPSGAGHDAMAMAALCPVAMLFVRCKGGISHHPAESITLEDCELALRALYRFLRDFPGDGGRA